MNKSERDIARDSLALCSAVDSEMSLVRLGGQK